jgi:beta-galactosidase GanA
MASIRVTCGTARPIPANDAQKEGRGLISVAMANAKAVAVKAQIAFKLQGNLGGEDIPDPARGVENNGGRFGERDGWYLPGYPDDTWATASVPASMAMSGISWYRTTFNLDIPRQDDASLGITIGDPSTPQSSANYRALIFVNGWNMGQYMANVGPSTHS